MCCHSAAGDSSAFIYAVAAQCETDISISIQLYTCYDVIHMTACIFLIYRSMCGDVDVENVSLITYPQQHIPEYAIVPEHVLAFKICTGAPAVDHYDEFISAIYDLISDIKLGCIM